MGLEPSREAKALLQVLTDYIQYMQDAKGETPAQVVLTHHQYKLAVAVLKKPEFQGVPLIDQRDQRAQAQ